ncbi:MAG: L,D-transpeptidase [Verrucomicrobiaceae bacterium]|nr:L,D-transpeptidase [Verrucomicrobiaceae bacterium]
MPVWAGTLDGITFAAEAGKIFLPVHEAIQELRLPVQVDEKGHVTQLGAARINPGSLRQLLDGTELITLEHLAAAGVSVAAAEADGTVKVGQIFRGFRVRVAAHRVEISLAKQVLQGWQGDRLVIQTHISSGKNGRTPAGEFRAGPFRSKMHFSSLYQNAPMPWSVQINGNIFIHGFSSVPSYPASHGCIRMPLTAGNPAKFFYEWVQSGSPVSVTKE